MFAKRARDVAPLLLGATLRRGSLSACVVEVEAYEGSGDPGSHAFRGQTPRNATMFGPPGRAYVYFTYGMHWMLNVSCGAEGEAGAVLIRAARPLTGQAVMRERRPKAKTDRDLLSGPAKLCQAFGIDGELDGTDLRLGELRLELGTPGPTWTGVRVGLAKGKGDDIPWRWVSLEERQWSSPPRPPRPTHDRDG